MKGPFFDLFRGTEKKTGVFMKSPRFQPNF